MITNTSKPTTVFSNSTKVSFGETWGGITTSWASETRDWLTTGSFFAGTSKPTTSFINTSKPI